MLNLKTFCVTNLTSIKLEQLGLVLAGVGNNQFSNSYINCKSGQNIQLKEKYYSELTFHYWYWKNMFNDLDEKMWIGFCQKRRFWLNPGPRTINNLDELKNRILREIPKEWINFDAILCEPINVSPAKKMKMVKRGWKNLIKDPTIFFKKNKQSVKLQFDMHHGYGVLDKAIDVMNSSDRNDFRFFVNSRTYFSPNIMFISQKKIMHKWFQDLFTWLSDCEKIFGFENLKGYDQTRLYAYLSERYLPFWFEKYAKITFCPWTFIDIESIK